MDDRADTNVEGTPFGPRYRLVRLLGRGGMGEVWEAFDPVINRAVALKVLPAGFADDDNYQERFRREAQAAAALDEPHVVPIYDFGEIEGRLFVTMRLIKGRDLDKILEDGPLPPARAVAIIEQIASALHAAHEVGLVHRDVKPSNILIAKNDFAYLIDFGIARAAGQRRLTDTAVTIGTWAYMAPERFRTGPVEPSSDTYALTCVLYQCLTGRLPFPGDALEHFAVAHLMDPVPQPSVHGPSTIPAAMDGVVATGLAKEPAHRYHSTTELAASARAAITDAPPPRPSGLDRPPPPRPRNPTPDPPPPVWQPDRVPNPVASRPPPSRPIPEQRDHSTLPKPIAYQPAPAEPRPAVVHHVAPQFGRSARPPWWRTRTLALVALAAVLLVLASLFIVRLVIRNNYYIAEYNGTVVIMRGIQSSLPGISLHDPYLRGCIDANNALSVVSYSDPRSCHAMTLNDLRQSDRAAVQAVIPAKSLDEAEQELKTLAGKALPMCGRTTSPPAPATTTPATTSEAPGWTRPRLTPPTAPTPTPTEAPPTPTPTEASPATTAPEAPSADQPGVNCRQSL